MAWEWEWEWEWETGGGGGSGGGGRVVGRWQLWWSLVMVVVMGVMRWQWQ
jgi:hypothetical protein